MSYTYEYPRPCVSVDCAIFREKGNTPEVLLIRRGNPPFRGMWAFPGGFIDMDETLEQSAIRELEEETGLKGIELNQLHTFGNPGRDPRARVITVAFAGVVNLEDSEVKGGDDASEAAWFDAANPPDLAFDHHLMLERAIEWYRHQ
jgi:8-oxo-dGTP diphosphatase